MTRVKLAWPARPRVTQDRNFGRCLNGIPDYLPEEWACHYPRWADKFPTRHRSLRAAQRAAEEHRNES